MKKYIATALGLFALISPLSACAGGYGTGGVAYAGGSYAYDGFYDDYYGPIYDGYWGDDGGFYYRRGPSDRRFVRGDAAHFNRSGNAGGHFHPMQGSMTPGSGMHMPHFGGAGMDDGGHGPRHH
jgi:hypothetical protein